MNKRPAWSRTSGPGVYGIRYLLPNGKEWTEKFWNLPNAETGYRRAIANGAVHARLYKIPAGVDYSPEAMTPVREIRRVIS